VTIALGLCRRVDLSPTQLYRLVGVGLSNFQNEGEVISPLFGDVAEDVIGA
jgi:DNA polymerase-4